MHRFVCDRALFLVYFRGYKRARGGGEPGNEARCHQLPDIVFKRLIEYSVDRCGCQCFCNNCTNAPLLPFLMPADNKSQLHFVSTLEKLQSSCIISVH